MYAWTHTYMHTNVSFFALLGATSSLTSTLSITVYRFIGILISALIFNAPPYPGHGFHVGLMLCVVGTLGYLFTPAPSSPVDTKKKLT